jgi:hypothetical protein
MTVAWTKPEAVLGGEEEEINDDDEFDDLEYALDPPDVGRDALFALLNAAAAAIEEWFFLSNDIATLFSFSFFILPFSYNIRNKITVVSTFVLYRVSRKIRY